LIVSLYFLSSLATIIIFFLSFRHYCYIISFSSIFSSFFFFIFITLLFSLSLSLFHCRWATIYFSPLLFHYFSLFFHFHFPFHYYFFAILPLIFIIFWYIIRHYRCPLIIISLFHYFDFRLLFIDYFSFFFSSPIRRYYAILIIFRHICHLLFRHTFFFYYRIELRYYHYTLLPSLLFSHVYFH